MPDPQVRRSVSVSKSLISRFEEIYPQHGAFTWFINSALEHFVEAHEITPSDRVREAVTTALALD